MSYMNETLGPDSTSQEHKTSEMSESQTKDQLNASIPLCIFISFYEDFSVRSLLYVLCCVVWFQFS